MKTVKIEPTKVYYYEAKTPQDQDAFIKHLEKTSTTLWTDLSPVTSYIPHHNAKYDYDINLDKADHVIFHIWTYEHTTRSILSFSVDFKAHKQSKKSGLYNFPGSYHNLLGKGSLEYLPYPDYPQS